MSYALLYKGMVIITIPFFMPALSVHPERSRREVEKNYRNQINDLTHIQAKSTTFLPLSGVVQTWLDT